MQGWGGDGLDWIPVDIDFTMGEEVELRVTHVPPADGRVPVKVRGTVEQVLCINGDLPVRPDVVRVNGVDFRPERTSG